MQLSKVNEELNALIAQYVDEQHPEKAPNVKNIKHVIPPEQMKADYATNAAMVLAKQIGKDVMSCAGELCERIACLPYIKNASVVKGYVNMEFTELFWQDLLSEIADKKKAYGEGSPKEKVLLEFISANPTGPLHVGHCRGAILGLAISEMMKKAGYDVTTEYYINDYGEQIHVLLSSIQFRYEQYFGLHVGENVPEGCYPGEYITTYAEKLAKEKGNCYVGVSHDEFYSAEKEDAVNGMMDIIRSNVSLLGLTFDSFASETKIVESGQIENAISYLRQKNKKKVNEDGVEEELPYVYEGVLEKPKGKSATNDEEEESEYTSAPQTLFRSTLFGDDNDRVLVRNNGKTTYFASDIAYHKNKVDRGFYHLINIFGADHGGYVKRLTSAVKAISEEKADVTVLLCQMVSLEKNGVPFKMSKRKGTFVLLSDVAEEVDVDELKLFILSKSPDSQMTFDMVKIKESSKDNPVYYIQYAYVRTMSLLKKFQETFGTPYEVREEDIRDFSISESPVIRRLMLEMAEYPTLIETAAEKKAPHLVVEYLYRLASDFHSLWGTDIKMVEAEDEKATRRHMMLSACVHYVLESGITCLSIQPKEKM